MNNLSTKSAFILCAALACVHGTAVFGEDVKPGIELKEAKAALEAASSKLVFLESRVAELSQRNEALTLAVAEANLEVGRNRSEAELALKSLEALGVDLLSGADGISGRLIKAANDLRVAQRDNAQLRANLVEISEAALSYLGQTDGAAESVPMSLLRSAVASANRTLEKGIGSSGIRVHSGESRLTKVVGLKPALGLLIVDAGEDMGLHEGAPLRIYRGGDVVAEALVVEVRSRVSGAIVTNENANSDEVAIGDVARLNLVNSFKN